MNFSDQEKAMPVSFSPAICHISLAAIIRNFQALGAPRTLMPVIKSDAYGHGLKPVARALAGAGALRFAVGTVSEGLALRAAGLSQEILVLLGCRNQEEINEAISENLVSMAVSHADIEALGQTGKPARIALKFDTGMGRLGFVEDETGSLLDLLASYPNLDPVYLASHLSCADMPQKTAQTSEQAKKFREIHAALRSRYPHIQPTLGNSAAMLHDIGGILRPGISLYGGNPFAGTEQEKLFPKLEWAMSLEAPILQIRNLPKGASISYGGTFTAPCPMRVAVIGAGYASGIPRGLSNKMQVLVGGKRCQQVGRVCMGMLMADIGEAAFPQTGDSAWIMGGGSNAGASAHTAQELADLHETIPYEILCLVGSLNSRKYDE